MLAKISVKILYIGHNLRPIEISPWTSFSSLRGQQYSEDVKQLAQQNVWWAAGSSSSSKIYLFGPLVSLASSAVPTVWLAGER